jgi:putative FmdB family regulatory protein
MRSERRASRAEAGGYRWPSSGLGSRSTTKSARPSCGFGLSVPSRSNLWRGARWGSAPGCSGDGGRPRARTRSRRRHAGAFGWSARGCRSRGWRASAATCRSRARGLVATGRRARARRGRGSRRRSVRAMVVGSHRQRRYRNRYRPAREVRPPSRPNPTPAPTRPPPGVSLQPMAAYEYLCMACEHRFEDRRPMTASVDTALVCPSCGGERVRRQFSFIAGKAPTGETRPHASGGCACGGACACGG